MLQEYPTLPKNVTPKAPLAPVHSIYTSMGIPTLVALTGNIQIRLPSYTSSPFAWLEAVARLLMVLSTAWA